MILIVTSISSSLVSLDTGSSFPACAAHLLQVEHFLQEILENCISSFLRFSLA